MAQADLTSFIPLSLLFIFTFFLPVMAENSWSDDENIEWFTITSTNNLRRASL
jgi:hypothetical protein